MWVPKLLLPSVKIKIFCFALGPYRPCRLIWWPFGWLIGGCGARAVSPKTPIYFKYSKWLFQQCVFVLNTGWFLIPPLPLNLCVGRQVIDLKKNV